MPSESSKRQIRFHAFALIASVVLHYLFDIRLYELVAASFAGAMLLPRLGPWYIRASRRAKLLACVAVMVCSAAGVGLYLDLFSPLFSPLSPSPPHAGHWLMLAFIFALPLFLFGGAAMEAWRVLRSTRSAEGGVPLGF